MSIFGNDIVEYARANPHEAVQRVLELEVVLGAILDGARKVEEKHARCPLVTFTTEGLDLLKLIQEKAGTALAPRFGGQTAPAVAVVPTGRADVFKAIHAERQYQELLPASRRGAGPRRVGEYLALCDVYLHRAKASLTQDAGGDLAALDRLRKVAALCVSCLEENGCPERGK